VRVLALTVKRSLTDRGFRGSLHICKPADKGGGLQVGILAACWCAYGMFGSAPPTLLIHTYTWLYEQQQEVATDA
jgi:hypothetical protein